MTDINLEIFKRYSAKNKLSIIEKLTTDELFQTKESTILKCIKEAGKGDSTKVRSRFKTLYLCNRKGNNWNSTVNDIYNWKNNQIFLSVYVQGDDIDTIVSCSIKKLLSPIYDTIDLGSFEESYLHSPSRYIHAMYDREDRAKVIKEILLSYIHNKYNI